MNTSLKFLSLLATVAFAATAAADLAGLPLPAGFGSLGAFAAFVITHVAAIFVADYGRRPRTLALGTAVRTAPKAAHPLAA